MQTHDLLDKDGSMVSLLDNNKIENSLEDFQGKSSNDILALDIQRSMYIMRIMRLAIYTLAVERGTLLSIIEMQVQKPPT